MTGNHQLRELDLQITNRCHQQCRHCCCSSGPHGDSGPSFDEVKRLVQEAVAMGVEEIHVTGGEPSLRGDCGAIMALIRSHGLVSQLQSTGVSLPSQAEFPADDSCLFMLSLDGLEENHDYYRGRGNFAKAIQVASAVRAAGRSLRINSVVTRRNERELEDLLLLAKSLGATVSSFFYFSPIGRGRNLSDDWIPPHEYLPIVERMRTFVRSNSEHVPPTVYFQCGYDYVMPTWRRDIACRARSRDFLVVLANGRVLPCTWYIDTELSLGDAFSEPLVDIFKRYLRFVDKMEVLPPGCQECELSDRCRGGCPAACLLGQGSRDPRCTVEHGIFPGCPEMKMAFTKGWW
jgi:radical SAM protein with 4Fe4S-binding SPASM domain